MGLSTCPPYPDSYKVIFCAQVTLIQMSPKVVVIAGFMGCYAGLLAEELLQRSDAATHGLLRRPKNAPESLALSPHVKACKVGASDTEALRAGLRSAEIVVCCYLRPASVIMTEGHRRT